MAIGLATGVGYWYPALVSTLLVTMILLLFGVCLPSTFQLHYISLPFGQCDEFSGLIVSHWYRNFE
jgi:hypothetical protein